MSQYVASNVKITVLKAGADFASTDDPIVFVNGKRGFANGFLSLPAVDGTTREFNSAFASITEPFIPGVTGEFPFNNSATFKYYDRDVFGDTKFGGTGIFESAPDDFVGQTTYKATGNEPLIGQGAFHFINIGSGSGSTYQLEYDINKIPTTGKLASEKGGVLNGKNTDGTLLGQGGKDIIYANDGDDIVLGRGNNDTLYGGKGNDLVWGGKGLDRVSGGAGKDTFVVARKTGLDTITDFRVGTDKIGLGYGLEYNDVSVWQKTGGTLLKAGSEQLAFLEGVKANQLGASSFDYTNVAAVNGVADATFA